MGHRFPTDLIKLYSLRVALRNQAIPGLIYDCKPSFPHRSDQAILHRANGQCDLSPSVARG